MVAVVGQPDAEWGETPVAVIVVKGDADPARLARLEGTLRSLCRAELAGYKQPRLFAFRTELPLTPAGKIIKREIRESLANPANGDESARGC